MGVTCNTACLVYANPLNKSAQELCRQRKACACKCRQILAAYPELFSGCEAGCHSNPKSLDAIPSAEQFLCQSPQDAYNKFGIVCQGLDPLSQTAQGINLKQQQAAQDRNTKFVWAAAGIFGLLLIIYFIKG